MSAIAGQFEDGLAAAQRRDYAAALKSWRPLAEQGDAELQFTSGLIYNHGQGVPQDDAEAVKWYRKAAEQGYAKAQTHLGTIYVEGQGVLQDVNEAVAFSKVPRP